MSVDGTKLLFEGFLQKRKDTMKIRWSTYWFRLQNTTLFFYTKKNGSASHLRGYYYMYTVQSVREVQRSDSSRRFMFEITMKNGKRKMLAAETAALRREWVQQLWEAMHLSFCRSSDCRDTNLDEREQRDGRNSSTHLCTHDSTVMESLPDGLISAPSPSPSVQIHCETSGFVASPTHQLQELDSDGLNYQQSGGFSSAVDSQEVIYDVLPIRKKICEINISTQVNEGLYDTPLSYKRPAAPQVPAESIYDIPSLHVREVSDHITEGHYEDICWRM